MSTVSPATIQQAAAVIEALTDHGVAVDGVVFDPESETFFIELADGGMVGTHGLGGGTTKDIDTEGLGGGTIKEDE